MATTTQQRMASFANRRTPDGEERLATRTERDDINQILARLSGTAASVIAKSRNGTDAREAGDQVNRFLLCTLVRESSRRIKASAQRAGESLPMTMIVRSVLRSYRLAAMDKAGPLAGPHLDAAGLRVLNARVLNSEIARHCGERVRNGKARVARAERLGDAARIRIEKDELEHALESMDRLTGLFR